MKTTNTIFQKSAAKLLGSGALLLALCTGCGGDEAPKTHEHKAAEAVTETAPADPMQNKGIGPITSVTLTDIDNNLVEKGKENFEKSCTSCHKIEAKHVGPALKGVTTRRSPEWIMNMILNPGDMTQKDPIAMELLATYMAPMANQGLTEEQARSILEYLRSIETK